MQRVLGMEWVVASWDWAHVRHVALTKMLREQRLHGFHETHRSADQLGRRRKAAAREGALMRRVPARRAVLGEPDVAARAGCVAA